MNRLIVSLFVVSCMAGSSLNLFAQNKLYPNEFPLEDVTLLDGPFKHARDLNIQVLLKYDTDRFAGPLPKRSRII